MLMGWDKYQVFVGKDFYLVLRDVITCRDFLQGQGVFIQNQQFGSHLENVLTIRIVICHEIDVSGISGYFNYTENVFTRKTGPQFRDTIHE